MISYSLMALPVTEVGPWRPQVIPPIISFPIASWPFSDCPSPPDWLYTVANCFYKTPLHCWITQLSKVLPYFKPKEKFHQNKNIKQKPGRFICKNNHNLIKYNSLSLYDLIHLGLQVNDYSIRALTTVTISWFPKSLLGAQQWSLPSWRPQSRKKDIHTNKPTA